MKNQNSIIKALDLRQHDGLLMSARIEQSTKSLFSDIERLIKNICEEKPYKSSTDNNGCILFVYKGKTCTTQFYEPDIIELDFDFREIQTDEDLSDIFDLLLEIASTHSKDIEVEAEGDKQPFAIVTKKGVEYRFLKFERN